MKRDFCSLETNAPSSNQNQLSRPVNKVKTHDPQKIEHQRMRTFTKQ